MGRLFDAVASLIGIRHEVTYEAQAAMELEACAGERIDQADRSAYRFEITRGPVWQVDTSLLWRQVCQDVLAGVDRGMVAARFHHAVANMVTDVCCRIRAETALATVGLTGGVFQNVLLLELTRRSLVENGFAVLTHAIVPPNDGGLALGQSAAARAMLSRQGPESRPAAGQTPGLSR
jgi:hydrogenase maturation protein HypF